MPTFDRRDFLSKAYIDRDGVYETLGVAWYVYAGALLGIPDQRLVDVLLAQQGEYGGFHAHYCTDASGRPECGNNVGGQLALYTVQHGPPKRLGLGGD